jgi:hypothetical protein
VLKSANHLYSNIEARYAPSPQEETCSKPTSPNSLLFLNKLLNLLAGNFYIQIFYAIFAVGKFSKMSTF